jgi:hypothetical protein
MISTQVIAKKTVSVDPVVFIDDCVKDLGTLVGTKANIQSGEKTMLSELRSKTNSNTSHITSKRGFSMDSKEYSESLNTNAARNKPSLEEHKKDIDEYIAALQASGDWEMYVDSYYEEEEAISIIGILSYLENRERGFGHLNDEKLFQDEIQADKTGKLYKEALKGFEFSKKYISLAHVNKKMKFSWKYS